MEALFFFKDRIERETEACFVLDVLDCHFARTGEKRVPLCVVGYLPTYLPTTPLVRSLRLRPRIYHRGTTSGDTRRRSRLTLDASRRIEYTHRASFDYYIKIYRQYHYILYIDITLDYF